jgi:hypothetical protein
MNTNEKKTFRPCVYVAGAYSSDNVLGVLGNIRRGLNWFRTFCNAREA